MPNIHAMPRQTPWFTAIAVSALWAGMGARAAVFAGPVTPAPTMTAANAPDSTSVTALSDVGYQPKYYIFPISDGDQYVPKIYFEFMDNTDQSILKGYRTGMDEPKGRFSTASEGDPSNAVTKGLLGGEPVDDPGFGIVSGINNRNEVLFRAGDVYRWTGHSLVWEHRTWGTVFPAHYITVSEPDPRPGAQRGSILSRIVPVKTFMAPLTAFAIDDAGTVMGTSWGGLYVARYAQGANTMADLLLANDHSLDSPNFPEDRARDCNPGGTIPFELLDHCGLIGGMNGSGQFVGIADVVSDKGNWSDNDPQGVQPTTQGFAAPIFYSGNLESMSEALPVTEDVNATIPAVHTGEMIALGNDEIDGIQFIPTGLNNAKHVIGYLRGLNHVSVPVIFEDGQWTIIPEPDRVSFTPACINDHDDIVGFAVVIDPIVPPGGQAPLLVPVAALLHNGKLYDLNESLPRDFPYSLTQAVGINDKGIIVAIGSIPGTVHAERRSFLLTPVPTVAPDSGPGTAPSLSPSSIPDAGAEQTTQSPANTNDPDGG